MFDILKKKYLGQQQIKKLRHPFGTPLVKYFVVEKRNIYFLNVVEKIQDWFFEAFEDVPTCCLNLELGSNFAVPEANLSNLCQEPPISGMALALYESCVLRDLACESARLPEGCVYV